MENFKEIKVKLEDVNKRIDVLICEKFSEYTRSFIQKLFLKEKIFLNGKKVSKHYKVAVDDIIEIFFPEPKSFEVKEEKIPIDIIFEDEDILVVNKKRGMVVHPAPGNYNNTLVNALMWHCKEKLSSIGGVLRPGIVHRIDKFTTGLIVVAKTDKAFKSLSEQIKKHSFNRKYIAVVHGKFREKEGTVNLPIGRSKKDRKKMAVNFLNGKSAVTHYKVLKEFKNFSFVELKLETGRTHQIRVHMAYLNHPIAGDITYGFKSDIKKYNLYTGQCLHARELGFFHYKLNKNVNFIVDADEYFLNFLNKSQKEI